MSILRRRKGESSPALAQPSPKLHRPVIPKEFLERPRLRTRFDAALSRKLTLVNAPAGYGKTVFLCEALGSIDRPVAWLSLDKRDDYLLHFWAGFIKALQKVQPGLGEHTLAMLRFRKPAMELALTELVNEISEAIPHLIIVLDDYHEISLQAIHDSLAFLIDYLPPQVRLFIASRVDPPLALPRLRGHGHLAEIQAADLQFTRDETCSFLNEVMGLALSTEQIDSIHDCTEGWIAGLQMVAVSMQGRRDVTEYVPSLNGTNKDVMEYLTKEVLDHQEEYIRRFLLETCILDRLTESLCNAVTGRDDSQRILERLVANHLFLQPLDDEGRWFRYHQLFRDLLHKQLKATQPDVLPSLHCRASEWYETQALTEDAIEHALAAEEFDRAGNLIQHIAFTLLRQDKYSMVQDWVARLPEEFVAKNLRICIVGAISCEAVREPESGEPYRRYAKLMSEALETRAQPGSSHANTTLGYLAIIKSLDDYHDGNIPQTVMSCLEGLKSLPEDEATARCALNYFLGWVHWTTGELEASYRHYEESVRLSKLVGYSYASVDGTAFLAHIRFAWGHLNSAAEACREAIQLGTASDGRESPVVCHARLLLAEILYQWNCLDESRENVIQAIRLSEEHPEPVIHLNGHIGLARLAIARGQSDAAMVIARRAKITHEGTTGYCFPVDVFMARLWLMAGNVAAASDYAHTWSEFFSAPSGELAQKCSSTDLIQHGIFGSDIRDMWSEIPLLTFVRLRLAQGKLDGMLELLEEVCRDVEGKGWTSILVEALLLKALVLNAEGKLARALRTLIDVLAMTEKEGHVRVFVDEGLPMFQLLHQAASRGIAPPHVSRLLAAFNMPASDNLYQSGQSNTEGPAPSWQTPGPAYMAEPLTSREIDVLELIAAGLPNRDIANKLDIALPTVKNHLRSIYEKLAVNNRARAITRAQEIGLLKAPPYQSSLV